MHLAWIVVTVPLLWTALLALLSWLEETTVTPQERAAQIRSFLESDEPDQIEQRVADLLDSTMNANLSRSR